MITFLNDKDDAQLRESFYRNIVSVVTFIGWPSPQILMPLLQQVGFWHTCSTSMLWVEVPVDVFVSARVPVRELLRHLLRAIGSVLAA